MTQSLQHSQLSSTRSGPEGGTREQGAQQGRQLPDARPDPVRAQLQRLVHSDSQRSLHATQHLQLHFQEVRDR